MKKDSRSFRLRNGREFLRLVFVLKDPLQKVTAIGTAGCNAENDRNKFFLCVFQFNAVQSQKDQHRMRTDSFVSVYEGMVFDKTISKPCGFLLNRGIRLDAGKALERRSECGFQKTCIPQTGRTAGFGDELFVKQENLTLAQCFHFASSSYALRFLAIRREESARTSSSSESSSFSA